MVCAYGVNEEWLNEWMTGKSKVRGNMYEEERSWKGEWFWVVTKRQRSYCYTHTGLWHQTTDRCIADQVNIFCFFQFLLRLVKGKKSRRTRSMRSESLRRRSQNMTCTTSPLPLSPSALQQSSEPTPSLPLEVPVSLQQPLLKQEEDLDGSQAKDSALGSEENHSDHDTDHLISPIDEEVELDEELRNETKNEQDRTEGLATDLDKEEVDNRSEDQKVVKTKQRKKGVTIVCPQSQ